jgi:hypothetical protein
MINLIILLYDKLEYMVRVNKELSESFFSFLGALMGDLGDRPGIGAPGHLFKSARIATYYNVLHYITMSSHEGYCWPGQLAKRDIMCCELERCWTTILLKG